MSGGHGYTCDCAYSREGFNEPMKEGKVPDTDPKILRKLAGLDFYDKNVKDQISEDDPLVGQPYCDGSDPERCVRQEHFHGLRKFILDLPTVGPCPPRHCRRCRLPENKPPFPYAGPLCICGDQADIEPEPKIVNSYTDYKDIDLFLDECLETMRTKGHDYREGSKDLTANFKKTGADADVDPMKVWYIFAQKHWSAIKTFIKEDGQSESEPIEGRIKDMIVYSLLLYRLVKEHKEKKAVL